MNLFEFDIRTLVFMLITGNLVSAFMLLSYKNKLSSRRPYYQFMAGKFLQAASWILIACRGSIPYGYSVVLANALLFFGYGLESVSLFRNAAPDKKTEMAFFAISIIGAAISYLFPDAPGYRVANASIVVVIFFLTAAFHLIKDSKGSLIRVFIALGFAIFSVSISVRAAFGLMYPEEFSIYTPHIVNSISFLAYFPLIFGNGIGFILMLKERDDRLLSESEEKFSKIFMSSPIPIMLSTFESGEILDVNPSFEEISGYSSGEIIGRNIMDFRVWEKPEDRSEFLAVLSSEGRLNSMESRFQKKSGEIIIGLLSSVIVNVRGNMVLLSSVYDITERKQNEIKLEHYSEQLRKEKVTKDKFFSIIAHDLRSPFQTLLSASEILARDIDSLTVEEIKTLSSGLNASLKKQYLLLTDLLNWSKLQAKDFALEKKMLPLNQLISEVLETLAFSAEEKKIKIQYDVPEGTTVFADNNMLKLVMRNLISNSIKFTNVNGTIDICTGVQGNTAEISVIDDGVGIAAQDISKLFRDDLRYSTIGTGDEEGSGLGLNLCREIIEKHGGTIRVESAEGQGSKFSFTLPSS